MSLTFEEFLAKEPDRAKFSGYRHEYNNYLRNEGNLKARAKIKSDTGRYRELQKLVQASKVAKENKALIDLRKQQESKNTSRVSEWQYTEGGLPCHKDILRVKQEREEKIQRYNQSVGAYNKECAEKAVKSRCKRGPFYPDPCLSILPGQDDISLASKRRSQRIVFTNYTEGVTLKTRLLEQEARETAERVEKQQCAYKNLLDKRELEQQKKKQLQQQLRDNRKAKVAEIIDKINKKTEARARRKEEAIEGMAWAENQLHLQREKEEKAKKKATLKETAQFLSKQVQEQKNQKKEKPQETNFQIEQCERDLQKERQSKQMKYECAEFNRFMIAQNSILEKLRKEQEKEEWEREVQRRLQTDSEYLEDVEKEIQKALADQRAVRPLMALRDQARKDVVARKKSIQRSPLNDQRERKHMDFNKMQAKHCTDKKDKPPSCQRRLLNGQERKHMDLNKMQVKHCTDNKDKPPICVTQVQKPESIRPVMNQSGPLYHYKNYIVMPLPEAFKPASPKKFRLPKLA